MNLSLRRKIRIGLSIALVILLTLLLSNYSASRAAEAGVPAAGKSLPASFSNSPFQASPLAPGGPPGLDPELLQRLKQNARGTVSASTNKSIGVASFVRVSKGGDLHPANQGQDPQGKALGFLAEYGGLFGVRASNDQLSLVSSRVDQVGATHLAYQQVYQGVPVFAGILKTHTDAAGNLTAVNGVFVPDLNLDTTPSIAADLAAELAIKEVLSNLPKDDEQTGVPRSISASEFFIESNTLYVYRDGLIQGVTGPDLLVYLVVVSDGASVREYVFVEAHSGKIVNRYSAVHDALYRRLFEQNTSNQVWQEGDLFPGSLNVDQQNIVNYSGNSYYLFWNAFGRDSYDSAGHEMRSVNNDPRISCPNANWNGLTTNYCSGVTADDVVAHEWGHAYTQYTSDLIYQWQPGALNESYSDIWGETVDLLNRAGTDLPSTIRTADTCSLYTSPVPRLRINSPATIAGDYAAGAASFGPPLTAAGVTGNVVEANDGSGATSDACTALVNSAAISGNIALVDRGTCAFTIKVKNAQNAGAIGVIVADNVSGPVAGMTGSDSTIVIPSLRVTLDTGNQIKSELANGVNATLTIVGGNTPEDSYRWLMGEDATAFGGAIRDMWSPNCKADPGKVTDSEYHCATTDGGGVHTNSGVPNHGYALLVDGGTYNGQTINGLGLVKAAHLYWRAQEVYQVPTSGFNDHADALEAACDDLIGVPLEGLSVTNTPFGPSAQSISASDCAEVTKMIAAVELRTDPTAQCNFQPILQPNPPPVTCTTGNLATVYTEDFKDGLASWTRSNQGVYSGWPGLDWMKDNSLPGNVKGSAAFAMDPNAGNCDGAAGDISGVMSLESPIIKIPSKFDTPRLTFNHYVATEAGYDGGNLKISVNGSPFTAVPASAFVYNPYNTTLQTSASGNTNPLAGQPAFSGTDGGSLFGSWGQSQIDLSQLGVKAGDTIRLRYDFGMDGCTGNDGWYVDDVTVVACKVK